MRADTHFMQVKLQSRRAAHVKMHRRATRHTLYAGKMAPQKKRNTSYAGTTAIQRSRNTSYAGRMAPQEHPHASYAGKTAIQERSRDAVNPGTLSIQGKPFFESRRETADRVSQNAFLERFSEITSGSTCGPTLTAPQERRHA